MEDVEALLFGFQSIADTVDVSYSDVIPGLIGLIPLISSNNIQLTETVMFTLGTAETRISNRCCQKRSIQASEQHSYM